MSTGYHKQYDFNTVPKLPCLSRSVLRLVPVPKLSRENSSCCACPNRVPKLVRRLSSITLHVWQFASFFPPFHSLPLLTLLLVFFFAFSPKYRWPKTPRFGHCLSNLQLHFHRFLPFSHFPDPIPPAREAIRLTVLLSRIAVTLRGKMAKEKLKLKNSKRYLGGIPEYVIPGTCKLNLHMMMD